MNNEQKKHYSYNRSAIDFSILRLIDFFSFRNKNSSALISLIQRLEFTIDFENSSSFTIEKDNSNFIHKTKRHFNIKNVILLLKNCITFYKTVVFSNEIEIISIDTPRLNLNLAANRRDSILSHIAPFNSQLKRWNSHLDTTPKKLNVIFDPKFTIFDQRITSDRTSLACSPITLILVGFWSALRGGPRPLYRLWRDARSLKNAQNWQQNLAGTLSILLFLRGYEVLFSGARIAMLSLTANSVFLEALRAAVLSNDQNRVVEIQHGVSNPVSDPFFLSFEEALQEQNGGMLEIVPLLGPPFCLSADQQKHLHLYDEPSNSAICRMFRQAAPEAFGREYTPEEMAACIANRLSEDLPAEVKAGLPIFSIFGGTDESRDYYSGNTFKVEMALTGRILKSMRALGTRPIVMYHPHPANAPISRLSIDNYGDVPIARNSQLAYFYADMAFSMYSAAIFEAAYLGVKAIAPLAPENGLFYPFFLEGIHHPSAYDHNAIDRCILDFAEANTAPPVDVTYKVIKRVTHFLSGSNHAAPSMNVLKHSQ